MRDVEQRPRPVDRLLIDDNSRLARNVVDILHITKHFNKSGVQVIAITQGLDCGSDSELQVSRLCALMDEQYRAELGRRIHRGQLGRVLNGYISGGRCYGYRNVPIDLTGGHDRATPLVLAVRREIAREQAAVVRRIFAQRANGHSFSKIADALNAELVPYPRHNNSSRSRWCSSTIQSILRNEHYRGVITWNRTRKTRSPETLEYKRTFRPEAEWVRIDCPECRIISEEMWERVRAKRRMHASPKRSRLNDKRLRERS
jgi:DNA invertase Pin-like site-specific DNA recombinase